MNGNKNAPRIFSPEIPLIRDIQIDISRLRFDTCPVRTSCASSSAPPSWSASWLLRCGCSGVRTPHRPLRSLVAPSLLFRHRRRPPLPSWRRRPPPHPPPHRPRARARLRARLPPRGHRARVRHVRRPLRDLHGRQRSPLRPAIAPHSRTVLAVPRRRLRISMIRSRRSRRRAVGRRRPKTRPQANQSQSLSAVWISMTCATGTPISRSRGAGRRMPPDTTCRCSAGRCRRSTAAPRRR